jgi:nucleotide-binding universal stress UspA family protein
MEKIAVAASQQLADPLVDGGRYVVGFDGSPSSRAALRWTVARAGFEHELLLVGVADDDGSMGPDYREVNARQLARLLSDAADSAMVKHAGARVSTMLVEGNPITALPEAAGHGDALVIGSDKTGYALGRVYGFRAVQLAARTRCPLVVVPSVDLRLREGVVAAVYDAVGAEPLVRSAAREAARRGEPLLLVHAMERRPEEPPSAQSDPVLAAARDFARNEHQGVEVISHLVHRRPAEAVLDLARDRAILFAGRSHSTHALGVGGTLHDLLINANVPIVVLP